MLSALCAQTALAAVAPTFYKDVLPILQQHCQQCHRTGEIAPMPFESYAQVRPYAAAIREQTKQLKMPPWFADARCGRFANDPTLSEQQLSTLDQWAEAHAPAGDRKEAPAPVHWANGWNIGPPDVTFRMPRPIEIPAVGDVAYTYVILPTRFTSDRWVRMSEIRPGNRAVVHHAVAYIREPGSKWLRDAPVGVAFTREDSAETWTTSDVLLVYAPGSSPDKWPNGYAKLLPAGSDIVLQMHYTTPGVRTTDQTSIGLVFSREQPAKRVLTLQLTNDKFIIPPGDPNHLVEVHGTLPNDALLLSFFPHMHLRGKSFEYRMIPPGGKPVTLLNIPHYDFYWQLSYRLAEPIPLKAGTTLEAIAAFDNSKNNPHNPDPDSAVSWGEQTWAEMMVGFFDVAVDPALDKQQFFIRSPKLHTR